MDERARRQIADLIKQCFDAAVYDGYNIIFGAFDIVGTARKIKEILKSDYFELVDTYFFIYKNIFTIASKDSTLTGKVLSFIDTTTLSRYIDEIIEQFLSYPKEYQVFIPLPAGKLPFNDPLKISDTVSIIKMDDNLLSALPPVRSLSLSGEITETEKPEKDKLYLNYSCKGFFGIPASSSIKLVESISKKILAALIVGDILIESFVAVDNVPVRAYIYSLSNEDKPVSRALSLPESMLLKKLLFNPDYLASGISPRVALQGRIAKNNYSALFSSPPTEKNKKKQVERVGTSLEWYFDGLTNENETFSYILFSTAIEALLGESEKREAVRVSEQLSDRIAFLIANDSVERLTIKSDFLKVYNIRSKIIHSGKLRLNETDRLCLRQISDFLKTALEKEILMLPKGS